MAHHLDHLIASDLSYECFKAAHRPRQLKAAQFDRAVGE